MYSCFCFILLIASSLGQLSFTSPHVSNTGEYSVSSKSNGQILTISSSRGFSWVLADTMTANDVIYVTLLCISSGSNADLGLGTIVANGYPSSYQQNSVLMPVVGNNFPSLSADTRAFYYPAEPPRAQTIVTTAGMQPVGSLGTTYAFKKTGSGAQYATYSGSGPTWTTATTTTFNTVSFEILNSGTAKWCIQTQSQVSSNKGICDPGVTSTCTAPTASSVASQTNCDSASTMKIYNYACVTQCPSTTLEVSISSSLSACESCTSPCASCGSGSVTSCTSCIATYYKNGNSCVQNCPSGKYADATTMTCISCVSPCSQCTGASQCTACISNYYLQDSQSCVQNCRTTEWANANSMTCDSCLSPCSGCSGGSTTSCTSCISNYYLQDGNTCVQSCRTTELATNTMICQACQAPCLSCSGTVSSCSTCIANYYLQDSNTCVTSCRSNELTNANSMTCDTCSSSDFCASCSGTISSCTSCISSYYLNGNTCTQNCPSNTLADANSMTCISCNVNLFCNSCSGNINSCTSCLANYYLQGSNCVGSCASNEYANPSSMTCETCLGNCLTCSGSTTFCTTCQSSTYLYKGTCVSKCPSGYKANTKSGKCQEIITSSSSGLNTWQIGLLIFLPLFCIATSFCLYKIIVARRRRVYPADDKKNQKKFSKLATFSPMAGHSFRVYPEGEVPGKFHKLATFFPPNNTSRLHFEDDAGHRSDDLANSSSLHQQFQIPSPQDTSRKYDDIPSFISSHSVRRGSPLGDTTRAELSRFAALNKRPKMYSSDENVPELSIVTSPSPILAVNTKELIKQTFNL